MVTPRHHSWGYSLCWEKYRFHQSFPLVGDVITSRDKLVKNGKRDTSSRTEILLKTWSSKRLCRVTMSRELDHNRSSYIFTVVDFDSMPINS